MDVDALLSMDFYDRR
jgi:hypothetical protein